MFLNSWSLALTLCSFIAVTLAGVACVTAIRVIRFWNPDSDSNLQIRLESEIWLSSTLVEYGLGFQIITLFLFVIAADHFSGAIAGAMCATGSLLANPFGMPSLLMKFLGILLYGFWILVHQFDIRSPAYPLVRIKYLYLLFLFPLLVLDVVLQTSYIAGLKPDIITSCCAVVFNEARPGGSNLLSCFSKQTLLVLFYGTVLFLSGTGMFLRGRWRGIPGWLFSAGWLWFLLLALSAITRVFSSYIYAMPYHNCPFCIVKPEYYYIGMAIYTTLIAGAFFGISAAPVNWIKRKSGLEDVVGRYQRVAVGLSLMLLFVFTMLTSYHCVKYFVFGGES